jgi:hypothetical protein
MECKLHQIDRLIEGVVGAVAVVKSGFVEAAHAPTDEIAQGAQIAHGLVAG